MPSILPKPRMVSDTHKLTPREQQLHDLLQSGLSDQQCAVAMGVKVKSVQCMRLLVKQKVASLVGMGEA